MITVVLPVRMVDGEPWWNFANCRDTPDSWWFGEDGKGRISYLDALECCSTCPVKQECLDSAMAEEGTRGDWARHRFGVRGGLTPWQRTELAKEQGTVPLSRRGFSRVRARP